MALRLPRSKGLVILIACGAGLVVFAGIVVASNIFKYVRLSSQAAMLTAVPQTFQEGANSGLFGGGGEGEDVTGFHPAYLLGALSAVLAEGDGCNDGTKIAVKPWAAYCKLPHGLIAVESNMMPELVIQVPNNTFDAQGIPLAANGQPPQEPDTVVNRVGTSFAEIRYSEGTPDQPRVSDLIVHGLTGRHLSDLGMKGNWLPARPGIGFRTCFASKNSTGLTIACYRGQES